MMNDEILNTLPRSLQCAFRLPPGLKGQIRIIIGTKRLTSNQLASIVYNWHLLGLRPPPLENYLREIRGEDLKLIDLSKSEDQVHPASDLLEKLWNRVRSRRPNLFHHREIQAAVELPDRLMVNIVAPIMKLGCRPSVAVFRMSFIYFYQGPPQMLILGFIVFSLLRIKPAALRQTQDIQNSVEPVFLSVF